MSKIELSKRESLSKFENNVGYNFFCFGLWYRRLPGFVFYECVIPSSLKFLRAI